MTNAVIRIASVVRAAGDEGSVRIKLRHSPDQKIKIIMEEAHQVDIIRFPDTGRCLIKAGWHRLSSIDTSRAKQNFFCRKYESQPAQLRQRNDSSAGLRNGTIDQRHGVQFNPIRLRQLRST